MDLAFKLRQDATYWAPTGTDTYGKTSFAAPVAVKVRWEDEMHVIVAKTGKEYTSKSTVYCAQNFDLDGYLYLGTSVVASPLEQVGAKEIQAMSRVPNLRALQTLYTAFL